MSLETLAEETIAVVVEGDVIVARQRGRLLSQRLGFAGSDPMFIATAISEIARNLIVHGGGGEIVLGVETRDSRVGIVVVARDEGPGIADVERAMRDGFSTVGSLGLGLPGARRLMDELEVVSVVGKGTTITMRKWTRQRGTRTSRP